MVNVNEIKELILQLADLIAAVVLKHQDPIKDEISERQAKGKFGIAWIEYHDSRNHIEWTRRGPYRNSPKVTSRAALIALREAEKLGAQAVAKKLS